MLGRGSAGWVGVVILSSPQAASRSRAERANAFDFIVTPPSVTDCPPDKGNLGATRRRVGPRASRYKSMTGLWRRDSKAERRSRTERAGRTSGPNSSLSWGVLAAHPPRVRGATLARRVVHAGSALVSLRSTSRPRAHPLAPRE